jgi:hypothetical protein
MLTSAIISSLCWILCELLGGLACLYLLGIQLWTYKVFPVVGEITSPVIWAIAFLIMPPLFYLCDRIEARWGIVSQPGKKWALRLAYVMTVGSTSEIVINEFVFRQWLGQPLYTYLVLPTFHGSGSLFSPLYYSTLLIHYPLATKLRGLLSGLNCNKLTGKNLKVASRAG